MKMRITALFLCILDIMFILCGCVSDTKPEDTLKKLIRTYNSCDVNGVISCFDPTTQELYEAVLQLAGYFIFPDNWTSEDEMKSLIKVGGSLTYLVGNYALEDGLPQLGIMVNQKTEISDRRVRINATFTYSNKKRFQSSSIDVDEVPSMTADLEMARDGKGKDWYILLFPDDDSPIEFYEAETTTVEKKSFGVQETEHINSSPEIVSQIESTGYSYENLLSEISQFNTQIVFNDTLNNSEADEMLKRLLAEHPEIFWIHNYTWISSNSGTTLQISTASDYSNIPAMSKELNDVVDDIVNQIPEGITDYEKILFVHDYLVENTEYDEKGAVSDVSGTWNTAYGCLIQHKAVCEGYSKAFQLIMHKLGFECGICSGIAENAPHAWNYVALDGNYYWIDVTWDDPTILQLEQTTSSSNLRHTYFLINDEMLFRTRTLDNNNLFVPVCNSLEENYFMVQQSYFEEYSFENIIKFFNINQEKHQIEMQFSSKNAFNNAVHKLFEDQDIWSIEQVKHSDSLIYYKDDDMYVLTICY